jgi:uncharacterized protein YbjT (DUF2867 family)
LGRSVVDELGRRGHEARVLARHAPQFRIDLSTGAGLKVALDGCEVVIDASNDASQAAGQTLIVGTERLLAAEAAAGVRHHVCISVVGCERIALRYFRLKLAQERLVEAGPTPWSIVRSTQFHEFVSAGLSSATRWGLLPVPRATVQSVAVSEVARVVASIAEAAPLHRCVLIAGPEQTELIDLARTWKASTGHHAFMFPISLPGSAGRALRAGALTVEAPDVVGSKSFHTWLTSETDHDHT